MRHDIIDSNLTKITVPYRFPMASRSTNISTIITYRHWKGSIIGGERNQMVTNFNNKYRSSDSSLTIPRRFLQQIEQIERVGL